MTPAARAIIVAALVVAVALGLYGIAATLDRWPELVIASWGAALGAGMAINGIALREMDVADSTDSALHAPPDRTAALRHQVCTALVAACAWLTAEREQIGWAGATVMLAVVWVWTMPRLVAAMERAPTRVCLEAYARAFQLAAIAGAIALIYASVALDTPWLWRPLLPSNLQFLLWLAILEFAGLPLTLMALRR
jgi:hypothetical protein